MFWNLSDADSIQKKLCSKNPCAHKNGFKYFWKLIGMAMTLGKCIASFIAFQHGTRDLGFL
eukprot:2411449-Karenia_brevis.AAC.1